MYVYIYVCVHMLVWLDLWDRIWFMLVKETNLMIFFPYNISSHECASMFMAWIYAIN